MGERIFSICVLFFALVSFSSIVASITGMMTSLRSKQGDDMKQLWLLRRYIRQRSVPKDLSNRILKFVEHQLSAQQRLVQAGSVRTLSQLSEALQNELMNEIYSPHLAHHCFFLRLMQEMNVMMHRICRKAVRAQSVASGDVIFNVGYTAKSMFFLKHGDIKYKHMAGRALDPPIGLTEWLSEAVLWTFWRHHGQLAATVASDLLVLDPEEFGVVMCGHPQPWHFSKCYAVRFLKFINSVPLRNRSDILREDAFYSTAVLEASEEAKANKERE